jgi:hypothetical protein
MHPAASSTCDYPTDAAHTDSFLQHLLILFLPPVFTALQTIQDDVTSVLPVGTAILSGSVDGTYFDLPTVLAASNMCRMT